MGCGNSTQAGDEPMSEVKVKHIERSQHSKSSPDSVSTVPHVPRQLSPYTPTSTTQTPVIRLEVSGTTPVDAQVAMPVDNDEDNSGGDQSREMESTIETQNDTPEKIETITCTVCCESVDSVSKPCSQCTTVYCNSCLRRAFMDACKDETMMPARCCHALNIGVATSVLTREEMDLYKRKHEEWRTPDRVYCPVPTCSVFIPYRLFPPGFSSTQKKGKNNSQQPFIGPQLLPPLIACPSCTVHICCSCKQLSHPDAPCPRKADELDPELEKLFKRWKIKRCPKCRAPVRKMYGCNFVICRCGGQWCFACSRPIDLCEEDPCEGADDDGYYDDEEENNENEDGKENNDDFVDLDEDASHSGDFGPEPEGGNHDPSHCDHDWTESTGGGMLTEDDERQYQCDRCWRAIAPVPSIIAGFFETETKPEPPRTDDGTNPEPSGDADSEPGLFACRTCSLTLCYNCYHEERGRNWRDRYEEEEEEEEEEEDDAASTQ